MILPGNKFRDINVKICIIEMLTLFTELYSVHEVGGGGCRDVLFLIFCSEAVPYCEGRGKMARVPNFHIST
jgi:hypothetical protein